MSPLCYEKNICYWKLLMGVLFGCSYCVVCIAVEVPSSMSQVSRSLLTASGCRQADPPSTHSHMHDLVPLSLPTAIDLLTGFVD